jgi:hypothetical protein
VLVDARLVRVFGLLASWKNRIGVTAHKRQTELSRIFCVNCLYAGSEVAHHPADKRPGWHCTGHRAIHL